MQPTPSFRITEILQRDLQQPLSLHVRDLHPSETPPSQHTLNRKRASKLPKLDSDDTVTLAYYIAHYAKNTQGNPLDLLGGSNTNVADARTSFNHFLSNPNDPTSIAHYFALYPTEGEHTDVPIAITKVDIKKDSLAAKTRAIAQQKARSGESQPRPSDLQKEAIRNRNSVVEISTVQNLSAHHPQATLTTSDADMIEMINNAIETLCAPSIRQNKILFTRLDTPQPVQTTAPLGHVFRCGQGQTSRGRG